MTEITSVSGNCKRIGILEDLQDFQAIARVSTPISTSSTAASYVLGLVLEHSSDGFQLEADVGGVRNVSGRTLEVCVGLVSNHIVSTNNRSKDLFTFSERSTDKVTWTKNEDSGRKSSIAGTAEQYGSKSSEAFQWLDNEIIRFRVYSDGDNVSLEPVSFTADGDTVTGPAFRWRLQEMLEHNGGV